MKIFSEDKVNIYNHKKMQEIMQGKTKEAKFRDLPAEAQARTAVQRMRNLVGVFRYLREDAIKKLGDEWDKVKDWEKPWGDTNEAEVNHTPENFKLQEETPEDQTPDDQNPDNLPLENLAINDESE